MLAILMSRILRKVSFGSMLLALPLVVSLASQYGVHAAALDVTTRPVLRRAHALDLVDGDGQGAAGRERLCARGLQHRRPVASGQREQRLAMAVNPNLPHSR